LLTSTGTLQCFTNASATSHMRRLFYFSHLNSMTACDVAAKAAARVNFVPDDTPLIYIIHVQTNQYLAHLSHWCNGTLYVFTEMGLSSQSHATDPASSRNLLYLEAENQHFRLAEETRCTDLSEIWHGQEARCTVWQSKIFQSVHRGR